MNCDVTITCVVGHNSANACCHFRLCDAVRGCPTWGFKRPRTCKHSPALMGLRRCPFGSSTTHRIAQCIVGPCGCPILGFKRPQGYNELNHPPTLHMVLDTLWVRQSLVPSSNSTSNSTVWVWCKPIVKGLCHVVNMQYTLFAYLAVLA